MKTKKPSLDAFLATPVVDAQAPPPHLAIAQREIAALKKQLALQRGSADLIVSAVQSIFDDTPPDIKAPPLPPKNNNKALEVAVLHLSDLQIGKRTADYDSSVAETRLQTIVEKTSEIVSLRMHTARIPELHIFFGGDLVEGEQIFAGQAHEIDTPLLTQACRTGPEAFTRTIHGLLPLFDKIHTHWVRGNHGRDGSKHGDQSKHTNWDTVAAIITQALCKPLAPRVTFNIAELDWKLVVETLGWKHLLCHGDQIKGMLGFPWYGFGKKVGGWYQTVEPFDYVWTGHFHTAAAFDINNVTVLANGTLESSNAYAQESLAAGGAPKQRLAFFNESHGLIADSMLVLDSSRAPAKNRWKGR